MSSLLGDFSNFTLVGAPPFLTFICVNIFQTLTQHKLRSGDIRLRLPFVIHYGNTDAIASSARSVSGQISKFCCRL